MSGPDALGGGNDDQLTGWKEIAAYLGKSVRGAQRWEREIGLPVHRVRTSAGQAVYARRAELDRWRVERDPAQESLASRDRWSPPKVAAWAAIAAATACGLIVAGVAVSRGADPAPTRFEVRGHALEARDESDRVIWRAALPGPIAPLDTADRPGFQQVRQVDLDGDGRDEVLAVLSFTGAGRGDGEEVLYCFDHAGRPRWVYRPDLRLTFGGRAFSGAWRFMDLITTSGAAPRMIWVAIAYSPWWPSAVIRIEASGAATTRMTHSGVVYALREHPGPHPMILAAGVNNEYAAASLAILDDAAAPSSSPQPSNSQFRCDGCPAGPPERYLLFPRSELNLLSEKPYNRATIVAVDGGRFVISTDESLDVRPVSVMYEMSDTLELTAVDVDDGYSTLHRALEARGRLSHALERCPVRIRPQRVRILDRGADWKDVFVPPGAKPAPGR